MSPSDTIAARVAASAFAALPARTVEMTKLALLDAVGVMLAASGMSEEAAPFRALALASGAGPSALLGADGRVSAPMAAFANGALAHALDYEDAFDAAPTHPNASLVPALLALAGERPVDGETLLTAMAVGCDLSCRVALSLGRPMEAGGWYPPPIIGALGASAGAARLLGLDARGVRDALSLALCQATAPGEIKHSAGTTLRATREAFPAQAAVLAAKLAQASVAGFERPLEGDGGFYRLYTDGLFDRAALLDGLGERFHGEALSFKRWPACRGTHAYIEAALRLRARPRFDWRAIDAGEVIVGDVQRMLVEPAARKQAPATAIDAKFSIFFTVAQALVHGRVGLDDFAPASLADRDVLGLAARLAAVFDPARAPTASGGELTLRFADGRSATEAVPVALGAPDRPIARDAMIAKFLDCAARAARPYRPQEAETLASALLGIERCDDVARLFVRLDA